MINRHIKNNHNNYFSLCLYAVLILYIATNNIGKVSKWMATHYTFSIKKGLLSRAFIGSILDFLAPHLYGKYGVIEVIGNVVLFSVILCFLILVYRYFCKQKTFTSLLMTLVFLTSPGTIAFFAVDKGRLDQIGYVLALIYLLLYQRLPKKSRGILLAFLLCVLVLIHEVLLVVIGSLLFAYHLLNEKQDVKSARDFMQLVLRYMFIGLPAILLAYFMLTKARLPYSPENVREMVAYLRTFSDFDIAKDAVTIHFRTINDNQGFTTTIASDPYNMKRYISALIALFPSFIIGIVFFIKSVWSKSEAMLQKLINIFLLLLLLMPLSLVFIGIDYPRWMASCLCNVFIIIFLGSKRISFASKKKWPVVLNVVVITILFAGLMAGGVTATGGPQNFTNWLTKIVIS